MLIICFLFFSLQKTGRRETAEARTTILQPVQRKPHSQKNRQNKKAEDYVPEEGIR